jgi:hypothetical protein
MTTKSYEFAQVHNIASFWRRGEIKSAFAVSECILMCLAANEISWLNDSPPSQIHAKCMHPVK